MIVLNILRKLVPARACLTCAGFAIGTVVVIIALSLLFSSLPNRISTNNCFFYIVCVNSPDNK